MAFSWKNSMRRQYNKLRYRSRTQNKAGENLLAKDTEKRTERVKKQIG